MTTMTILWLASLVIAQCMLGVWGQCETDPATIRNVLGSRMGALVPKTDFIDGKPGVGGI